MADNIYTQRLGGILGRGFTGNVTPKVSAVDQLRQYQESLTPPPNPLVSPAQRYMQEVARERATPVEQSPVVGYGDRAMSARQDEILRQAELNAIADIATPRLLDETSPARVTNNALRIGNEAGESKLLERMARSGLLSTLQGMARAERMYGVGPLAAFSESALDVQAARSAAEQEAAKRQSEALDRQAKLQAEQIKKSGFPELKGPQQNLVIQTNRTVQSLDAVNEYLKILTTGQAGGLAGNVGRAMDGLAALAGFGQGSVQEKAEAARGILISTLNLPQLKGQISAADYANLEKYISDAGSWWKSNSEVRSQLENLKRVLQGSLRANQAMLQYQGIDYSKLNPYTRTTLSTPGRIINE
jgi:hypothetical protein